MSDHYLAPAPPTGMPVLGRGRHRHPARGACFMEYSSLLAGEAFTDHPRCVDDELATVLRGANDQLSDGQRHLLVPLLGRAIGLVVEPPPVLSRWRVSAAEWTRHRQAALRHRACTSRLRREVAVRFTRALGIPSTHLDTVWSGWGEEVAWLFWDLMTEPTAARRSEEYVRRLVDRVHLLHACYEEAMDDLGLSRPGSEVHRTAEPETGAVTRTSAHRVSSPPATTSTPLTVNEPAAARCPAR
ncbi:hypothetical protein ACI79C_01975 [Geodermatophilus sp. SYSU D00697]